MEVIDIKEDAVETEVVDIASPVKTNQPVFPVLANRRNLATSFALAKDLKEVEQFYSTGITAPLDGELNSMISAGRNSVSSQKFEEALASEKPSNEAILEIVGQLQQVDSFKNYLEPGITAMIMGSDPANRDYAINKVAKVATAASIVQQKIQETVPNLFSLGMAADFADTIVSSVPFYTASVAKANQKFADRFQEIIYSNASLETLEAELKVALDEASDAGLFTEDNALFLMDMIDVVNYGSGSNTAKFQEFMSWVDIGLFAATAKPLKVVGGVKRVAGYGANTVSDFSNMLTLSRAKPNQVSELFENTVILDDPSNAAIKLGNTSISSVTPIAKRPTFLSSTVREGARVWEENSRALMQVRKILNYSGKALDEVAIETLKSDFKAASAIRAVESGNKRFIDSDIVIDDFENLIQQEFIGKTDGTPFVGDKGFKAAKKLTDKLGSAYEVRPYVNPNEYVIVKETNVPMDQRGLGTAKLPDSDLKTIELFPTSSTQDMRAGVLVDYLGTPQAQTTARNNALLKQAEAADSLFKTQIKQTLAKINKGLKSSELDEIYSIEQIVRDDPETKAALTASQFKQKFFDRLGKQPTADQVTAYLVQRDLLDAQAMIYADKRFKELVSRKAVVVEGSLAAPIEKANMRAEAKVFNMDNNTLVSPDEIDDSYTIYANLDPLDGTMKGGSLYFTKKNPEVRRVFHSDVLQYNAGGPRIPVFDKGQHFVKQERTVNTSDGLETSVSPLTIMAVRTEAEANKAIKQVNNIVDAITQRIGKSFKNRVDVIEAIKALPKNKLDEISEVVSENNEWLPRLSDVDTLISWAEEGKVNLIQKFSRAGDGERIVKTGEEFGVDESETYGDAFRANAFKSYARKDTILVGYGGAEIPLVPPREALERSLLQATGRATERAYITGAINGFLREAMDKKILDNARELRGLTLRQKIADAKIQTSSLDGKRLELERQKILSRINSKTYIAKQWENMTLSMSDFLYSKGFVRESRFIYKWDKDPLTALRGYVFDAKMGMFNPDQFWVQAMSVTDVVAIGGVNGIKGSSLYGPVRFALANGHEGVIRRMGGLIESATGLTEKQFTDMVTFLKESGRANVGDELSEFGDDASQASLLFTKLREKGRFFLKEGELVSRIAAHNTSFIEFYAKFGNDANPFSEVSKRWITSRQDTLTLGMTGASRTSIEQFPFAQFMSYTQRVNEALFSGTFNNGKKILSNAEKTRLASMHTLMYGAAGWTGFNFIADRLEHVYGKPIDEVSYNAIRKGLLDHALYLTTGIETDLGARLGAGEGMFALLVDMSEKNVLDFFLGPSGDLGQTILGSVVKLAGRIATGEISAVGDDALLFLREIKTVNTVYNSYIGLKYNEARSKSNNGYLFDVSDDEVYLRALGIPLEKEQDMYRHIAQTKIDKLFISTYAKQIQKFSNNMEAALRAGDFEEAERQSKFMSDALNLLDPIEREQALKLLFDNQGSMLDNLINQGIKNERFLLEGANE